MTYTYKETSDDGLSRVEYEFGISDIRVVHLVTRLFERKTKRHGWRTIVVYRPSDGIWVDISHDPVYAFQCLPTKAAAVAAVEAFKQSIHRGFETCRGLIVKGKVKV